jgi:hypothetical protein
MEALIAAMASEACCGRELVGSIHGYSDSDSSWMTISFSFPLSDILGRVSAADLGIDDVDGAGAGTVKRDDEATGCFAVVVDDDVVLMLEELAVGLEEVDVIGTAGLVLETLAVGTPVVGGLELDDPLADGFSVEVVVRGFTAAEVDVRGFKSSCTATLVGWEALEIDSGGREAPTALEIVLREVVAAALLSGAVVEVWAVDVGFVAVELVVLRGGAAGSAGSVLAVVRTVLFRVVVVVNVEAVGALTIVLLLAGTDLLIGASSRSLAFPLPATVVAVLLLVVFACGSGSDTFKIRSISLANISSSSPATSAFLPLVTVALDVVRVVRGVASSGLDAERVARRVGISITPLPLFMKSI